MSALVEPPQLPAAFAVELHCGAFDARHRPVVLAAVPWRNTGPQAAVIQPAYLPLARPWYQASLKSASVETRSSWISFCQYCMTFVASGLERLMPCLLYTSPSPRDR